MTRRRGCWPRRNRITGWTKGLDPRPSFHYLAEDDDGEQVSEGLNHLVPRNGGGAAWTWKKATVVVDSGGSRERDAEEHVPRDIH